MGMRRTKTKISPQAILSVAEDLFSSKGYKGTSITDISKRLKVSKPALYYHFKNKMEILENLYSKTVEQLSSSFEEVMNRDLSPDEKFKKLIENQVNIVAKNAKLVKIYFGDYKEFPRKIRFEIREKRKRFNEKWVDLYREGMNAGLFQKTDPKIAVYMIVGACNWIQMWYSRGGELRESELANMVADLLSKGFLTRR
jgi:AcrR family transcriptional regulator